MRKPKLLTLRNVFAAAIVFLLVAQGITWHLLGKARQDIRQSEVATRLVLNELDYTAQQSSLSAIPGTKRLYLPELNLTVPLNTTTSSVRYNFTEAANSNESGEARLSSAIMTDHITRVKSCSDMVRLKIETQPNVYSPDQPHYATVKLADGRTLQVYANTTKECESAWIMMSPQAIAKEFKEAASY